MTLKHRSINRFKTGCICLLATLLASFQATPSLAALPSALPPGPYHTMGNQIVDGHGSPVRLACVYWQGMNLLDGVPHSLGGPFNGFAANMNAISAAGFNCVRLDWNNQSLHTGNIAVFLQQMDQAVATAKAAKLKMIFTDHDNEGLYDLVSGHDCASQQHNGIWYDLGGASDGTDGCNHPGHTTQASFLADWSAVAARYAGQDTVIGYELWNEPFAYGSSTWGDGTPHDIRMMYQDVGSAILARDPGKLIFAECPENHGPILLYDKQTVSYAPWGDCTGVRNMPVVFHVNGVPITHQVVYDVHCYPSSISGIASIFGSSAAPGIIAAMNASFGFLVTQNIAPVWNGEGGTGFYNQPDDGAWAGMLAQYLNGELGAQGAPTFTGNQQGLGFAWMDWGVSYGPTSDNLGMLQPNGALDPTQLATVQRMLFYPKPNPPCVSSPDGTYLPKGAGSLTDGRCNNWTVAPDSRVAKNGMEQIGTHDAVAVGYKSGFVTFKASDNTYYTLQ